MPDITMCSGGNCPNKEGCYRYTATPSHYWQSYFIDYPENKIQGYNVECSMFIDNSKYG